MKLPEKPLAWMHGGIKSPPFYAVRPDAIVILGVEKKATQRTPNAVIAACAGRLAAWDRE
jgi:hypothetical protein